MVLQKPNIMKDVPHPQEESFSSVDDKEATRKSESAPPLSVPHLISPNNGLPPETPFAATDPSSSFSSPDLPDFGSLVISVQELDQDAIVSPPVSKRKSTSGDDFRFNRPAPIDTAHFYSRSPSRILFLGCSEDPYQKSSKMMRRTLLARSLSETTPQPNRHRRDSFASLPQDLSIEDDELIDVMTPRDP